MSRRRRDPKLEAILAANLRRARVLRGLTQHEAAVMVRTTDAELNKWEKATRVPDVMMVWRLARIYRVAMDTLFVEKHPSLERDDGTHDV